MSIYNNNPSRSYLGLYKPSKNEKITCVKYMFFANFSKTGWHILIKLQYVIGNNKEYKMYSIHFSWISLSFRVFGCQSWHKLHIAAIEWTIREVNENVGMCGSVDFLINFITRLLCVGATWRIKTNWSTNLDIINGI